MDLKRLVGKGVFSAWDSIDFFKSVYIDKKTENDWLSLNPETDATSLVFTNVVISRSTVKDFAPRDLGYQHGISMWSGKGPFTTERFLKMMNYSREDSPEGWHAHMQTLSQT